MRKSSLIATALTLAVAGAPVVTVASATPVPDPIAHAATQHETSYTDPLAAHPGHEGKSSHGATGTGSTADPGHAYGKACASESHKHVKGHPGTPFSECVHALKTLHAGTTHNAKRACAAEPRKHVKGEKGTPFSRCVAAANAAERAQPHAAAGPR